MNSERSTRRRGTECFTAKTLRRSVSESLISEIADTTYLIRELGAARGADDAYEVTKFVGKKEPQASYTVSQRAGTWHCDCPGFDRSSRDQHKHIRLVREWIAKGKPDPLTSPGFQSWAHSILKSTK